MYRKVSLGVTARAFGGRAVANGEFDIAATAGAVVIVKPATELTAVDELAT
jgi:hypothetical protein